MPRAQKNGDETKLCVKKTQKYVYSLSSTVLAPLRRGVDISKRTIRINKLTTISGSYHPCIIFTYYISTV